MQDDDLDFAARYRQRAEELRAIADQSVDPNTKAALLALAEDYERLAQSRGATERKLEKKLGRW